MSCFTSDAFITIKINKHACVNVLLAAENTPKHRLLLIKQEVMPIPTAVKSIMQLQKSQVFRWQSRNA